MVYELSILLMHCCAGECLWRSRWVTEIEKQITHKLQGSTCKLSATCEARGNSSMTRKLQWSGLPTPGLRRPQRRAKHASRANVQMWKTSGYIYIFFNCSCASLQIFGPHEQHVCSQEQFSVAICPHCGLHLVALRSTPLTNNSQQPQPDPGRGCGQAAAASLVAC